MTDIKLEVTSIGEPLVIDLDRATLRAIGTAIAATTRASIRSQKQADGSQLKVNAPQTRRRKRRLGRPLLSLVDEKHRLVAKGSYLINVIRGGVEVMPRAEEIARFVQLKGYTGWFGISAKGRELIRRILGEHVRKAIAKASQKTTKRTL